MLLQGQKIIIIGGSSGIGLATANAAVMQQAEVIIAGRSLDKLEKAKSMINSSLLRTMQLNNQDEKALKLFFETIGHFDHLFTPGATYVRAPLTASYEVAQNAFFGKFWPQYLAVKYALPFIAKTGSIVLMSGAYSQRPVSGGAAHAACNGAIESLGRALAVELAPLRVNVIAPGVIETALWEGVDEEKRKGLFDGYKKQCALNKIGSAEDIAQSVIYLMSNQFTTGSTLYPDGGYTLR